MTFVPVRERDSADGHRRCASQVNNLTEDVNILAALMTTLVVRGHGSAGIATPVVFDIDASYTVIPIDTIQVQPRGMSFDLPNNAFVMDNFGVWQMTVNFSLAGHNSVNSGRTFNIRLRNLDDGGTLAPLPVGVGRNVEDTFVSFTSMFDLAQGDEGERYVVEAGGVDSVTGGTLSASVALNNLSPLGDFIL